jgi:hypothetical protein
MMKYDHAKIQFMKSKRHDESRKAGFDNVNSGRVNCISGTVEALNKSKGNCYDEAPNARRREE